MLAFAQLPDPVLHAFTTGALREFYRVVIQPKSLTLTDGDYWEEDLMELRAVYTQAASAKAATALLKSHRDPTTLWAPDLHHWAHVVVAFGVAAERHERDAKLGLSRVGRVEIRPLLRHFLPKGMWAHPADMLSGYIAPKEFFGPDDETGELEYNDNAVIGPKSLVMRAVGPPPTAYLAALAAPLPPAIPIYPIPEPGGQRQNRP